MKQEYGQFEILVVGNGKGKRSSGYYTFEALDETDATATPHTRAWNDADQVKGFQAARSNLNLTSKVMDKQFEIQARVNYNQQKNKSDCGVFLLKFVDYLSSGLDINHVQPENMPFFRLKLAIELIRGRAFVESLYGHHLFQ
ncbi:hypothetical protein FF1_043398 [Malus domestica]